MGYDDANFFDLPVAALIQDAIIQGMDIFDGLDRIARVMTLLQEERDNIQIMRDSLKKALSLLDQASPNMLPDEWDAWGAEVDSLLSKHK